MKTTAHFSHFSILIFFILAFSSQTFSTFAQNRSLDSLYAALKTTKTDTEQVKLLYNVSKELSGTAPMQALEYGRKALSLSQKINFKEGENISYNAIGVSQTTLGNLDSAMFYFTKHYELSMQMGDSMRVASACDNLGIICLQIGQSLKALQLRHRANHIYETLNKKNNLASGYTWIGNIYKDLGDYPKALDYYLRSLKACEELNDQKLLGYPLVNISSIYRYQKQYKEARSYAFRALETFEKTGDITGKGASLFRLALIYAEEENYLSSLENLKKARLCFESTDNTNGLAVVLLELGRINLLLEEKDSALVYYDYALPIVQKMGDKANLAILYNSFSPIYNGKKEYAKALEYDYKSLQICREINNKQMILGAYRSLICTFSLLNQPDSVVWYFYQYTELSDSMYSQQISRSIAEMQTKYETEKKEKEILGLNLENEKKENELLFMNSKNEIANLHLKKSETENERNLQSLKLSQTEQEKQKAEIEIQKLKGDEQAKAILEEKAKKRSLVLYFLGGIAVSLCLLLMGLSNYRNRMQKKQALSDQKAAELSRMLIESDMKALRAQMNPHFIFNCVHTIERLLNDARICESKTTLQQFSMLSRSVLENSKKREITLEEEVKIIQLYMDLENARFPVPFTYTFEIDQGIDPAVTMIPPLILQPFVENSIKHGFNNLGRPGHLHIGISSENGILVCAIEDNGLGRKESMKIRPTSGFKKESMGMKLVEERLHLINQAKGTKCSFFIKDLEENNKPAGTSVKMFLPLELSV